MLSQPFNKYLKEEICRLCSCYGTEVVAEKVLEGKTLSIKQLEEELRKGEVK